MVYFFCTQIWLQNQKMRIGILLELKKGEKKILAKKKNIHRRVLCKSENGKYWGKHIFAFFFPEIKYLKPNLIFKVSVLKEF